MTHKPTNPHREMYLVMAITVLRIARDHAQKADAPGTAKAIGRAIESATRAQRRMGRRRRTEEETP